MKQGIVLKIFLKIKYSWMMRKVINAQRRSRRQITTEDRNDLFQDTLKFMVQHQIILESDVVPDPDDTVNPIDEIEIFLKKLSIHETEYRLMPNKLHVYPMTFLTAVDRKR